MSFKDVLTEDSQLVTIEKSPLQRLDKEQLTPIVNRVRAMVPNGENFSVANLTVIAQESYLFRTLPGRDIHYYEAKNGLLQRVEDYKYLKNFASFKEQLVSGNDTATVDDKCRPLTDEEKERHQIPLHCLAAECRIITARERKEFAEEVKRWLDMGFDSKQAIGLAKEIYGDVGTVAIGVVDPNDLDRWGKPVTPPHGWSYLQWAEKRAFKNAIHRKYGIPTADEMQAMAYRMANRAMPEHWRNVDPALPQYAQARQADLEALAAELEAETLNHEEREARFAENVVILRGEDDHAIGETDQERFVALVVERVPWYSKAAQVREAMKEMDINYDVENETFIFDELATYANKQADMEAQ